MTSICAQRTAAPVKRSLGGSRRWMAQLGGRDILADVLHKRSPVPPARQMPPITWRIACAPVGRETKGEVRKVVMTVQSLPFVPPAPTVHPKNLPVWRLLWKVTRSTLSIWPDYAFDALYIRNRVMGIETLVVNDPEGVRHVLTANAANYQAPSLRHPLRAPARAAQGFFLRKAPIGAVSAVCWRRRSRPPALACCCRIFATRVFICCFRLKDRRQPISRKPFRTRLWRRSCAPCSPCRRAATARH